MSEIKNKTGKFKKAIIFFAIIALAACAALFIYTRALKDADGLANFHKVSDILYRGARPAKEGFAKLK
ncbi:MAG: hypothetical protein LBL61_04535, partial [Elusimicrobiota bacterium]|nr:hypothetical protein [Elusimicrobiota bacterium]